MAEKDCGKKFCTMELQFQTTCTMYFDASTTETCDFPCSLDHCTSEIHYSVQCPVWTCFDKTTTVAPFTTTPEPPSTEGLCASTFCKVSVALNVVLFMVAIGVSVFLKKRFKAQARVLSDSNSVENPLFRDETPIIRSRSVQGTERLPLLTLDHRAQSATFFAKRQRSHSHLAQDLSGRTSRDTQSSGFSTVDLTSAPGTHPLSFETSF